MANHWLQRVMPHAPFALAIVSLVVVGWAAWHVSIFPYDRREWPLRTDAVAQAAPSAIVGNLWAGDWRVPNDGMPFPWISRYADRETGSAALFFAPRDEPLRHEQMLLAWAPLIHAVLSAIHLGMAFAFWSLGFAIVLCRSIRTQSSFFVRVCKLGGIALASGAVVVFGPLWMLQLFALLLWWLGPPAIHPQLAGGLYLSVHAAFASLLSAELRWLLATHIAFTLLWAMTIEPLHRRLQIVVSQLRYGSWYDYRSVVKHVSQALAQAPDRLALAQTLPQCLQKTMRLQCASLLLSTPTGALALVEVRCGACRDAARGPLGLDARSPIYQHFRQHPYVIAGAALQRVFAHTRLAEAERQLLLSDHARFWIPLFSAGRLHGLCLLGPKHNAKQFDANDVDILQVVARLASSYFQNAQLIAELQQRAKEIAQMHQQILRAREEERKRVARDLHDQIIQELVGLNYNLSKMRDAPDLDVNEQIPQLQRDTRQILGEVRRICADLRPPALDSLGLVAAVRSRLRDLERQAAIRVVLRIEGDAERRLPEDISLCIFRVLQEALANAHKHACASRIEVSLRLHADELCLVVEDDGAGFQVPQNLGQLLEDKHFGLVGLRERLDLVQGSLEVMSRPGSGTRLHARVPLLLAEPALAVRSDVYDER